MPLMTGAHEFRSGVTHTLAPMRDMNRAMVTLPEILATAGYRTGMFGKWHLGQSDGHAPWERGFDEAVIADGDADQGAHSRAVDPVFFFNGELRQMQGVREFLFADEAIRFMGQAEDQPFFCYLATHDPHKAYWAEPRFGEELQRQLRDGPAGAPGVADRRLPFFAEILQLDWNLGRVLDFLEARSLANNTLVVLMGDNGGTDGVDAFNSAMRGHKTTAWRGGTRAPAFWRLPGVLEARDLDHAFAHIDVLPTLAEVAGASLCQRAAAQVQGRTAWGMLTGTSNEWPERTLFTHVARWNPGQREQHRYQGAMVRRGPFDLVRIPTTDRSRAYSDRPNFHRAATPDGGWALYHRHDDPAQERDLADEHPELVARLIDEFERWWDHSREFLIHEP
jgi:arylsulfatase A-like enzyme